jgi:hypothetical protein
MIVEKSELDELLKNPYQDELSNPFGTPEEKKARNKAANIAACGSVFNYKKDNPKKSHTLNYDGGRKVIVVTCKCYRECDGCRAKKYDDEVEPRLNYAQNHMILGDRPRFDRIMEDKRDAYMKRLSRGNFDYYTFPQPNDELIVIHNDPNGEGDELWEFGYDDHDLYNEDNGFDINFYTVLKQIPEGKRISGNLGKKQEDEEEPKGNGSPEQEQETFSIKKPFLFKEGLSERDVNMAYIEAVSKTLNISVETEQDLQDAMFARINAMAELIDDSIVGFTWDGITEDDLKLWNKNPNNFSNVQITTIDNNSSNYLDKNHKKSSFEAMVERAGDEERQQYWRDFYRDEAEVRKNLRNL